MRASSEDNYPTAAARPAAGMREDGIEVGFVGKLKELKYEYRRDITNRAALEKNFREKFEALNRVKLTDSEFARLLDEIVGPDVFKASKILREINAFSLAIAALQSFVDGILERMIFDAEQLGDLFAPLDFGWKARTQAELALMEDLHPLLTKRAQGRDISGLSAYEQ